MKSSIQAEFMPWQQNKTPNSLSDHTRRYQPGHNEQIAGEIEVSRINKQLLSCCWQDWSITIGTKARPVTSQMLPNYLFSNKPGEIIKPTELSLDATVVFSSSQWSSSLSLQLAPSFQPSQTTISLAPEEFWQRTTGCRSQFEAKGDRETSNNCLASPEWLLELDDPENFLVSVDYQDSAASENLVVEPLLEPAYLPLPPTLDSQTKQTERDCFGSLGLVASLAASKPVARSPRHLRRSARTVPLPCHVLSGRTDFASRPFNLHDDKAVDRIARVIMRHEGAADEINWNDNRAGVSGGMFQANQKYGELPMLLKKMQQADCYLFRNIFGQKFSHLVASQPEAVRAITFTNPRKSGPNALGLALQKAIRQPQFQEVELDMLRQKVLHASYVARQYGIGSERGVALVADMINQLGEGRDGLNGKSSGARRYLKFALEMHNEMDKLRTIAVHDYQGLSRKARDKDIIACQRSDF